MKMKALKPILITAAVLIVLIAGYFLIDRIPDPKASVSPSPTPQQDSTEIKTLYNEDYYSLQKMELEFKDGSNITIDVKNTDEGIVFRLSPAKQGWTYNQESLRATAFNMISISSLAKVAENVTDFSQYELDKPALIARSTYKTDKGTEEKEIHFGKMTSLKDSYYAVMKGDNTVYAVSKITVEKLMTPELQYRELSFFPTYLDVEKQTVNASGSITYIRVRNPGNDSDIEVKYRTDAEMDGLPVGSTRYYLTMPVKSDCNDTNVEEKLVNIAAAIQVSAVVEDDPEDLKKYGLDTPIDVWMKNTDGQEIHYLIGKTNGETAYAMVEGTNTVLVVGGFSPTLANLNYVDYMFKLVWIHSIDKVKTIVYDMNGDKRLLEIRENKKDDKGKVVAFDAVLDGRPISETNTRRLFSRMLSMIILGDLDQKVDITDKKADYTFTVNMIDGSVSELKLYALNERQYAASVDGAEASFYINVSDIRNLEKAFDYVAKGEEIPR